MCTLQYRKQQRFCHGDCIFGKIYSSNIIGLPYTIKTDSSDIDVSLKVIYFIFEHDTHTHTHAEATRLALCPSRYISPFNAKVSDVIRLLGIIVIANYDCRAHITSSRRVKCSAKCKTFRRAGVQRANLQSATITIVITPIVTERRLITVFPSDIAKCCSAMRRNRPNIELFYVYLAGCLPTHNATMIINGNLRQSSVS